MKFVFTWMFGVCLLPGISFADITSVRALTYSFAPLQIENTDNNLFPGYAVEIVQELFESVKSEKPDIDSKIEMLPFKRAYLTAEIESNIQFFSISRTEDREDKFHWVGEISPYELYFFKLTKNTEFNPKSLNEILKSNNLVAVQSNSNMERLLIDNGFKLDINYVTYPHFSNGIKMLFRERFAMLPLTLFVARKNACDLGFDSNEITPALRIDSLSQPLWLVFSKSTPAETVSLFQKHYAKMVERGFVKTMQRKYLDVWETKECDSN